MRELIGSVNTSAFLNRQQYFLEILWRWLQRQWHGRAIGRPLLQYLQPV